MRNLLGARKDREQFTYSCMKRVGIDGSTPSIPAFL